MSDIPRTLSGDLDLAAARMEARVVLTQPSALCFLQDWERALNRACEVACRAGVPEAVVREVCEKARSTAAASGRELDWVAREVRHELATLVGA